MRRNGWSFFYSVTGRPIAVMALALVFSGCAGTRQFVPTPDTRTPVSATSARIYIVRPSAFIASGDGMEILDGGKPVGTVGNGGYLCWDREPEKALIGSKKSAGVELDLKPGETVFLRARRGHACFFMRDDVVRLGPNQGESLVRSAKGPR